MAEVKYRTTEARLVGRRNHFDEPRLWTRLCTQRERSLPQHSLHQHKYQDSLTEILLPVPPEGHVLFRQGPDEHSTHFCELTSDEHSFSCSDDYLSATIKTSVWNMVKQSTTMQTGVLELCPSTPAPTRPASSLTSDQHSSEVPVPHPAVENSSGSENRNTCAHWDCI